MTVINFVRAIERPGSCRICRSYEEKNITFFQNPVGNTNGISQTGENAILNGINKFLPITIMEDDGFSPIVCFSCVFNLMLFQELVTTFNKSRDQAKSEKYDCCYICAKNYCFFYPVIGMVNHLLIRIKRDASPDIFEDESHIDPEERTCFRVCMDCLFLIEKCREFQRTAKATDNRLRRLPLDDSDDDFLDEKLEGVSHLLNSKHKESHPDCNSSSRFCNPGIPASGEAEFDHDYHKRTKSDGKNTRKRKKSTTSTTSRAKKSRDTGESQKSVAKRKQPKSKGGKKSKTNTNKTGKVRSNKKDDTSKKIQRKTVRKTSKRNVNDINSSPKNSKVSRKRKNEADDSAASSNKSRRRSFSTITDSNLDLAPSTSSGRKRNRKRKNEEQVGTSSNIPSSTNRMSTRSSKLVLNSSV